MSSSTNKSKKSLFARTPINLALATVLLNTSPAILAASCATEETEQCLGNNNIDNSNINYTLGVGTLTQGYFARLSSGNTITIDSGTTEDPVYGGDSANGDIKDNTINIGGDAIITSSVYGGHTESATVGDVVENNRIIISDSATIYGDVAGGFAEGNSPATITNNHVTINNSALIENSVYGGVGTAGNVIGNSVTLNSGTIALFLIGGFSSEGSGDVIGNSVIINDGTVNVDVYGGFSPNGDGNADNNSVIINAGNIGSNLVGGASYNSGNANGNRLTINGGHIEGVVVGGGSELGNAINNVITIAGTPTFGTDTIIFGGYSVLGDDFSGDIFTGNTLNLHTQISVNNVQNFEYYNFYLPASMQNGQTMLNLTGTETTNIDGSTISVQLESTGLALKPGDVIHLMQSLDGQIVGDPKDIILKQGISLVYDVSRDPNHLGLTMAVENVSLNPQTKALSEGRTAGLALLNQSGDLLMQQGMGVIQPDLADNSWTPFAIASADSSRYKTGSHIDVDGVSLMFGSTYRQALDTSALTLGGFVEMGEGNYRSYNDFDRSATVKGSGNSKYYGVGVLARHDHSNHIYTEGSARLGRVKMDFESGDLMSISGESASFDSSSAYYSAHLGLGYIWAINEQSNLDIFSKYLWTRQNSDTVSVLGDQVEFAATNSHRLRTGLNLSYAINKSVTPYAGAAYEYEFDGKSKATTYGYDIDAPTLKGGTGILELGINIQPTSNKALSVNLGVNGYAGQREGVSGQVQIQYKF